MPKVKIISDSTCDLTPELIDKYEIGIVPLYIRLGTKTLKDGAEVTPDNIFEYVGRTGTLPGTVASSVEDFRACFRFWRDQGYEVICHTISGEMSCTYQNAVIAANEIGGIYVVDSRNLSTGVGHVVINAAVMAQRGMAAPDIVKVLEMLVPKVRASFILDTLDYMKKGGRCSSVAVFGANLLKIRPSIVVDGGVMKLGRKYRGVLAKVLENYVDSQLAGRSDIRTDRIFITHTGCPPELVRMVEKRIRTHLKFDEILETRAGCTVTSHSGPNTLGILYVVR